MCGVSFSNYWQVHGFKGLVLAVDYHFGGEQKNPLHAKDLVFKTSLGASCPLEPGLFPSRPHSPLSLLPSCLLGSTRAEGCMQFAVPSPRHNIYSPQAFRSFSDQISRRYRDHLRFALHRQLKVQLSRTIFPSGSVFDLGELCV